VYDLIIYGESHQKIVNGKPYYYLRESKRVNGKPKIVRTIFGLDRFLHN
jgi:hypothetical protein